MYVRLTRTELRAIRHLHQSRTVRQRLARSLPFQLPQPLHRHPANPRPLPSRPLLRFCGFRETSVARRHAHTHVSSASEGSYIVRLEWIEMNKKDFNLMHIVRRRRRLHLSSLMRKRNQSCI